MTSRITAMLCATAAAATAAAAFIMPAPAGAEDTVKLAYIDPLSGGGASIGEVGLKTFNYLAEVTNAKGGVLGKKLEIVPYDNKLNAQESLVQVQKAIDSGIRFITQGNGSAFAAAIEDFVAKYNDRNPGKEVLYFNYAAVDPVLTNDKCSYWHFRWDANSDIKMTALTNYMKTRTNIKKLYLINQDYSFGQAVRAEARKMIGAKRPDIEIVGDEVHPLLKVTGLLALHRQDQGLRRRQRHHRQLGPGFRPAAQGRRRRRPAGRLVHLLRRRHRRPDRRQAGEPAGPGVRDRRRRGQ
jgi:ABC-type branched-subunit amino acid transport system substrate-binding protein